MITHVKAIVFADIKNLDFAGVMRHDVAIRFLYAAQAIVDIADDFYASVQRDLEMQGALDGPCLKEVVGPDTECVERAKCSGENGRVIVYIPEQHCLIEELDPAPAKFADSQLSFFRDLAKMIDLCHNHRRFFRRLDFLEQVCDILVAESLRVIHYSFGPEAD